MRTYEGPFVGSHFKWQISHLRDINLTRSAAARCLPGGMDRAAARGDREQKAWLHTMTGDGEATIGASATLVSGAA
jgi:hypothetical protein